METTKTLRRRAREGDPDAQFRLGYCLAFNRARVRPNWKSAADWWDRAARSGHGRAYFYLGTGFYFGRGRARDAKLAAYLYRLAAAAGNEAARSGEMDAASDLGYCYHE